MSAKSETVYALAQTLVITCAIALVPAAVIYLSLV